MVAEDASHYEQDALWTGEHDADHAAQRLRFDAVAQLLPADVRSVVDLGAGDGRVLEHLRRPGLTAIAVDRSGAALRRWNGPAVQASIDAAPLRERGAEAALCCEVLEHLPSPSLGSAVVELARVAERCIVLSVPNRENRRRNAITCRSCGCRYNPDRHLRSFDPEELRHLVPGFTLAEVIEAGPRHPIYPRALRMGLERAGLLNRPGSPSCPQCGEVYPASLAARGAEGSTAGRGRAAGLARLAPRRRHAYWLCARYERC